jgi:chromosome partitioning protein
MRAVMVANPKGGAGKTMLATNLSGHFANTGKTVCLCDLDRQQSALRWLAFRASELPAITGYFGGNQMSVSLPCEPEWVVLDAPVGFQGYKLNDFLRAVDRVVIPGPPMNPRWMKAGFSPKASENPASGASSCSSSRRDWAWR